MLRVGAILCNAKIQNPCKGGGCVKTSIALRFGATFMFETIDGAEGSIILSFIPKQKAPFWVLSVLLIIDTIKILERNTSQGNWDLAIS